MLSYPSIDSIGSTSLPRGSACHCFLKYDGSNIRFEWDRKKGFHKFGSRHQLIDKSTPLLGESIELFCDDIGPKLVADLTNYDKKMLNNAGAFTTFAEFFGKNSFAGNHEVEPHTLKVFDVSVYKKGFLDPDTFVKLSEQGSQLFYAKYLGVHSFNDELTLSVYDESFLKDIDCMQAIAEGIILKKVHKNKALRLKLKTKVWLDAIKGKFDNWKSLV